MFDWFRKKDSAPLEFADNRAAFDYACSHLPNRILLEAIELNLNHYSRNDATNATKFKYLKEFITSLLW